MAVAAILKNHKNCDITASDWLIFAKFGTIMQNGLLTIQTVEKFEFPKSKMADGRHFKKNVKSPYLRNRLTDCDENWHADAD